MASALHAGKVAESVGSPTKERIVYQGKARDRTATDLPPESIGELLIRCLRVEHDAALSGDLQALGDVSWHRLVAEAVRQGVAPLLHYRLGHLLVLPRGPDEILRDIYLHNHLRNLAVFGQLSQVLSEMRSRSIPIIPLKGAHLASRAYPEPALRPMQDLDLLARPSDMARVHEALLEIGYADLQTDPEKDYSEKHHIRPVTRSGAVPIEVHHRFSHHDRLFAIDWDALWAGVELRLIAGVSATCMSQEDLLLHVCIHAAYNHRFRGQLLAICDVDALVRAEEHVDWERLINTGNGDGRAPFAYTTIKLAQRMLGTPIPVTVSKLNHDAIDDEIVGEVHTYLVGSEDRMPSAIKSLATAPTFNERLRLVARSTFPTRDSMRRIHGLPAKSVVVYWYYFLRPWQLLRRRWRDVWATIFRTERVTRTLERDRRLSLISRWTPREDRDPDREDTD